jgi:hypothetical protein
MQALDSLYEWLPPSIKHKTIKKKFTDKILRGTHYSMIIAASEHIDLHIEAIPIFWVGVDIVPQCNLVLWSVNKVTQTTVRQGVTYPLQALYQLLDRVIEMFRFYHQRQQEHKRRVAYYKRNKYQA